MRRSVLISLCCVAAQLEAANYTVKSAGGGTYTTISACAAVAKAGDTCTVFAGTYSGWTQTASGTAGNPITFTVNPGDSVTINSNVATSGTSYVAIGAPVGGGGCAANATDPHLRGRSVGGCFIFSNAGIRGGGSGGATSHYTVTYNTSTGTNPTIFVNVPDGYGGVSSDNVFAHNYLNWSTSTGTVCSNGYYVYGDRNRFEFDEFTGTGDDYLDGGGVNVVIRNNDLHDNNMSKTIGCGQSPEHADFYQDMGAAPTLNYALIENNVDQNCSNDGGNCHALLLRGNNPAGSFIIYRFNYTQQMDGSGISNGAGSTDVEYNNSFYNNTIATENDQGNGDFISCWGSNVSGVVIANNLSYHTGASHTPFMCQTSSGTRILGGNATDGTQTFNGTSTCGSPCYSLSSGSPFVNYPTDGTLTTGSALIGGGVAIAHVTSASGSGTQFTVDLANTLQPGWAGTQGDCIRIGASGSNTACITGLSYGSGTSGTVTVNSSVSWANGAGVFLWKRSDGTQVLNIASAGPDVGAFPYQGTLTSLAAPVVSAVAK